MEPVVTVLLANRNYDKYLRGAIKSVLNQTYPKWQLCIIDDCSTDNSWSIVEDLFAQINTNRQEMNGLNIFSGNNGQQRFIGIKIPQNVGPSEARNIGIQLTLSETDVYAILDADDEMYPNKLEKCLSKLLISPDVAQVYADYHIFNVETGNLTYEHKWPYSKRKLLEECIPHSASVLRKDALLAVRDNNGFYDRNLVCAEDYDLWLRLSEKYMICHIPEALSLVRVHKNNSVGYRSNQTWQQCWSYVAQKTRERNGQK